MRRALRALTAETIFALSSGGVRSGVAVIRVSGPEAHNSIAELTKRKPPPPRLASVRRLLDPFSNDLLDHGLVLRFDEGHSFTGEQVAEFQVHGGNAVVSSVLRALEKITGMRHAEPGEFTRRSFWNERMDLTQVEGISDLIAAETEEQRKQALSYMTGKASKVYQKWKTELMRAVAQVEAYIDFSEEENIEDDVMQHVDQAVDSLVEEMERHLQTQRVGERISQGLLVTITGPPDVGKSTLLNILCRRDAAIVSSGAGTTRDVLQISADVAGFPVVFQDTAGIRYGADVGDVEREGVRRAEEAARRADLRVCVQDSSRPDPASSWCQSLRGGTHPCHCAHAAEGETLVVLNKIDTAASQADVERVQRQAQEAEDGQQKRWENDQGENSVKRSPRAFPLSCKTEEGLSMFLDALAHRVKQLCTEGVSSSSDIVITRERHRHHIASCLQYLKESKEFGELDVVARAQVLRFALNELGMILGTIHFEDILDELFAEFCIGK